MLNTPRVPLLLCGTALGYVLGELRGAAFGVVVCCGFMVLLDVYNATRR